ncbi:MAG: hypothetical protein A4E47_00900 [Methanosaeta sp. PtaU1.Bin028]|nr:MAG: hypothetical protein A4E47_00900 [Methanosaeta sp. PtaU1.Bin028]
MRLLYWIVMVILIALSSCAVGQNGWFVGPYIEGVIPECAGETQYVDPGERIVLDGTSEPDYPQNTMVNYAWTFITDAGIPYDIYNGKTKITMPVADNVIAFNAPMDPGCYKMVLTVTYSRSVTGTTLSENCISYTCIDICVNPYQCYLCDDTFCEDELPTEGCPAVLCYDNALGESFSVNWYVDNTLVGSVTKGTSPCIEINWDPYTATIHYLEMKIFGPTGEQENPKCTGIVSIIDRPEASIQIKP